MANNMINEFKKYLGIEHDNPFTILEAKATESKTTKEVNEKEVAGYDYKDDSNLNNQIFDQYINGLRVEMEQNPELLADNPSEALLKAKEIVLKNLKKDPIFYTKNAAFGIKGLGYETSTEPKEPTGKHKSSGYGDIKENTMNKSEQLKELLEEAVAGMPSIGNPFAERKTPSYEEKFAKFLAEEKEKAEEAANIDPGAEPKGMLKKKADHKQLEEEKPEEKKSTKEGKKKQPKDVVAEIEKVAEMAGNYVKMKEYQKKISELKETYTSISEDENLQEFIDESKTKSLQEEIALYEKYCNEATEAYEYNKNNK
jgi:hypothetical protein